MEIKIKVEKMLDCNLNKEFKIIDLICLTEDELPEAYLCGKFPMVYMTKDSCMILRNTENDIPSFLHKGAIFWEKDFKAMLKHIKQASQTLKLINSWSGTETYCI